MMTSTQKSRASVPLQKPTKTWKKSALGELWSPLRKLQQNNETKNLRVTGSFCLHHASHPSVARGNFPARNSSSHQERRSRSEWLASSAFGEAPRSLLLTESDAGGEWLLGITHRDFTSRIWKALFAPESPVLQRSDSDSLLFNSFHSFLPGLPRENYVWLLSECWCRSCFGFTPAKQSWDK